MRKKRCIYIGDANGILGYGCTGFAHKAKPHGMWAFYPDGHRGLPRGVFKRELKFTNC